MPRYAHAQLRWSERAQTYILSIGDQVSEHSFSNDWLEQNASFGFQSQRGTRYTVRKQRVQRGGSYWYAYRRLHGQLVKRYLGRTADLTFARLEEIAHLLEDLPDSRQRVLAPEQEIVFSQPIRLALHSEGAALPLLLSKLSPPRLHTLLLDRSRLFALLDAGREGHLTLISAPAGSGKTTLVGQWMVARRAIPDFPPVAWVSLENEDNDPLRFWRYLIAACQTFQDDLAEVRSVLAAMVPKPPFLPSSLETMLTALLNALARCPSGGVLVLEDYHVINEQAIHGTLSFFIEHLPATCHLVLVTRSDPPFSLARLRARNMLYEIRATDLRFSQEETTILLQQSLSFPLETATVRRLQERMEGWGAGLHLAKLALQKTTTAEQGEQILARFSSGNAAFQEYFVAEVLNLQPEPVQQFLLQTSILTRLTDSLCDAVTGQPDGRDMLALLERTNLFLEPLNAAAPDQSEASRQWYRYHALFSAAMRNEARRRFGEDRLPQLFARASRWYEAHGYSGEAIDAALDARDYERAAALIERTIEEHTFPGEIHEPHTLHRWCAQFPETILEQHPVLCFGEACARLFLSASWLPSSLTLRELERLLQYADRCFRAENDLPKLGELSAFHALLTLRQGDMRACTGYAKQALGWLVREQRVWRSLCLCIVAREWTEMGQLKRARTVLLEALSLCEAVKNNYFQRFAMLNLAQIGFNLGEIQQAISLYRQVIATARVEKQIAPLCNALSGLALLYYERNELENASRHAQEAITLSQSHHLMYQEVYATGILARVQQVQGQIFVAQQQLAALFEKIPVSSPNLVQEIQAAQARLALATGDHVTMQRWVTERPPQHDFSQESEEKLLVCRWLRTQGKLEDAARRLEHLRVAVQKVEHTRLLLEVQVEMVLVAVAEKRKTEAQQMVREALALALHRNALRPFLDAGEQIAILSRTLLPQLDDQPLLTHMRALLSAFPVQPQNGTQAVSLLEPLSPQEMRVLRLLVQHRSNADIADALVVSVNTIRTQVQSIYSKLGVHTRAAASEVARELHLI